MLALRIKNSYNGGVMKNSILSTIGKQFLFTMTMGFGVVILSIPSVAEANPAAAAAKAIFKDGKIVSKAKPIKVPTQATGSATHTGGNSYVIPAATAREIERQRREQERRDAQNRGWYN